MAEEKQPQPLPEHEEPFDVFIRLAAERGLTDADGRVWSGDGYLTVENGRLLVSGWVQIGRYGPKYHREFFVPVDWSKTEMSKEEGD